jgi:phthiocerol/phenolphthiocerol synthesis type-I polyketide synthase E
MITEWNNYMSKNDYQIAIVGMSGEFPGATNLGDFWKNLLDAKETICALTDAELIAAGVSDVEYNIKRAGTLDNIDYFAADFFGYSPREAALIDPQQRKMLEHALHAFEDAAINPYDYEGAIGVYVGSSLNTYLLNNLLSHPDLLQADDIQQVLFGNGQDYLATRIAYQFNCKGAAINIQTACSTSLVAIHEACQQLLTYQVDVALTGGVSIAVPQQKGYLYSVDGMLSADGHCRPFSDNASGTVFSSGLGVVVLKRLEDALAQGNPIYALIKGSALNNDGFQKVGYTAPSVAGQTDVITLAHAIANVTPDQISFIETHGTGTQLGDPIELVALQNAFSECDLPQQSCAIGSLKSNIGHLDVAAGIAGFMKAALVLKNRLLPTMRDDGLLNKKFNWH